MNSHLEVGTLNVFLTKLQKKVNWPKFDQKAKMRKHVIYKVKQSYLIGPRKKYSIWINATLSKNS